MSDGTWILAGQTAEAHDCPNCTSVGFIEFILLDDEHLYQNRAMAGPSHDHYTQQFPPYRYKWEGPLASRAQSP